MDGTEYIQFTERNSEMTGRGDTNSNTDSTEPNIYIILDGLDPLKNILPEMLTILPESKTRVILLASRAIYSCIPRKRVIQYYYYYSYRALCVNLLSNDRG